MTADPLPVPPAQPASEHESAERAISVEMRCIW
jgi:hypothetical protein